MCSMHFSSCCIFLNSLLNLGIVLNGCNNLLSVIPHKAKDQGTLQMSSLKMMSGHILNLGQ